MPQIPGLSRAQAARSFAQLGSDSFVAKPSGDTRAGVINWKSDSATGYLIHLKMGAETVDGTAAIGIGTDRGVGSGLLVSHKNSGAGARLIQHGGSGFGSFWQGYANNPLLLAEMYAGSGGFRVDLKTGSGYGDGVTTQGSTTFTSATAAFTAGDVGQELRQSATTGESSYYVPAGTTIVSVTNATTVVLSAACTGSGTGIKFRVFGRVPSATQNVLRILDTDGTTVLGQIQRGLLDWHTPALMETNDIAVPALKVLGKTGQTANVWEAWTASGAAGPAVRVQPTGRITAAYTASVQNAGLLTNPALQVTNFSTQSGAPTALLIGVAAQLADQLQIVDSAFLIQSRFNKAGYFMTRKTAAPADADLVASEVAAWFDSTTGATKMMFKGKNAAGAVVTAEIPMAASA